MKSESMALTASSQLTSAASMQAGVLRPVMERRTPSASMEFVVSSQLTSPDTAARAGEPGSIAKCEARPTRASARSRSESARALMAYQAS
jgi:hypothetical protein